MSMAKTRTVCFVTGTRAEFGLMANTLRAIEAERGLRLRIVATGMHLDRRHGRTVDPIRREGWRGDATVPWRAGGGGPGGRGGGARGRAAGEDLETLAAETGRATAGLAKALEALGTDVVLVVGDRVEAFAAATAGHLSGRVVAHVHGGDRALGQVDDALRHAITKLSHIHFAATKQSAERIRKLGEDAWRIFLVGTPGIDGISRVSPSPGTPGEGWGEGSLRQLTTHNSQLTKKDPHPLPEYRARGQEALLVLHPIEADDRAEYARA